ncbi:hypothetical protein QBC43DRAFT_370573 [Cladorrhinum sp. PSN259]|nr:hypothetical protein QBC43DRAFT_370573 [Cladorrhinum sp. PSN259]
MDDHNLDGFLFWLSGLVGLGAKSSAVGLSAPVGPGSVDLGHTLARFELPVCNRPNRPACLLLDVPGSRLCRNETGELPGRISLLDFPCLLCHYKTAQLPPDNALQKPHHFCARNALPWPSPAGWKERRKSSRRRTLYSVVERVAEEATSSRVRWGSAKASPPLTSPLQPGTLLGLSCSGDATIFLIWQQLAHLARGAKAQKLHVVRAATKSELLAQKDICGSRREGSILDHRRQ